MDEHAEGDAAQTTRREFLKKAGAASVVVAAGVPVWAKPAGAFPRLTQKPIKIGFWSSLTGPLSPGGLEAKKGFDLYLDKLGGKIMNRPVEVVYEDDQGNPSTSLTVVQKLTEQDKVSIVIGGLNAASGPPVSAYCSAVGMPWIDGAIATDNLTQRDLASNQYHIRVAKTASQGSHYLAAWVRQHRPEIKNVSMVMADFALGYESGGGFQDVFQRLGGAVVQRIFIPLGTADPSPFISSIDTSVDAVYLICDSLNSIRFLTTYQQLGLKAKIPLFTGWVSSDETVLAANGLPSKAVLGNISESAYSGILNTPANYDYQRRYNAKYAGISVGGSTSVDNWCALQFTEAAIKRRGGDITNRHKLLQAFIGLKLTTPRGVVEIGTDHNAITTQFIRRVDPAGGKLPPGYTLPYQNTILQTIPHADQYWKFQKAGYLARPRYSRAFPPVHAKK